jgi:hypothetical protein
MRLINEFVQIQSEFFEGDWNNDFDIDPVIISSFFLDGGRYCEGSIHNLHRDLPKRRRRNLGLVVESAFGVNRVSAPPNEYQCEFGSTLCLKTEIFSLPFRSKKSIGISREKWFPEESPVRESKRMPESPDAGG